MDNCFLEKNQSLRLITKASVEVTLFILSIFLEFISKLNNSNSGCAAGLPKVQIKRGS